MMNDTILIYWLKSINIQMDYPFIYLFAFEIMAIGDLNLCPSCCLSVGQLCFRSFFNNGLLVANFFHIYLFKKLTMKILLLGHYFLNYYMP